MILFNFYVSDHVFSTSFSSFCSHSLFSLGASSFSPSLLCSLSCESFCPSCEPTFPPCLSFFLRSATAAAIAAPLPLPSVVG